MRPSPTLDDRLRAFLAFVDADDALDPDGLERTLTDDEVDHELAAAGFDVPTLTAHARAEHDTAVAILAAAESTSRKPKVIVEDKVRRFLAFVDADPQAGADLDDSHLSDEELDRQLAAAGFDVEALTAKAKAEHEDAVSLVTASNGVPQTPARPVTRPEPASNVIPLRRTHRTRWVVALAAAAAFAALVGSEGATVVAWVDGPPKDIVTTSGIPLSAEDLRYGAASAAVRGQWARCLELLDRAKRIDPEGDRATEVQERRKLAERMLGGGSDASTGVEETP